jgi:hypothetical protein
MPSTRKEAKVLGSWKEIAAYLGKGVRTVQRWEHELDLPVSRPQKAHKGHVLTSTDKLDQWVAAKWIQLGSRKEPPPNRQTLTAASISDFRRLRQEIRDLSRDLRHAIESLRDEPMGLARTLSGTRRPEQEQHKASFVHRQKPR